MKILRKKITSKSSKKTEITEAPVVEQDAAAEPQPKTTFECSICLELSESLGSLKCVSKLYTFNLTTLANNY